MHNKENNHNLKKNLNKIAFRIRIASIFNIFFTSAAVLLLIYSGLLLTCRLFALIPDYFNYISILIPLCIAAGAAILFHPTPDNSECAKRADNTYKTKDLFYTATSIDKSHGEYSPVLLKSAEEQASIIIPSDVVKFRFTKPLVHIILLILVIFAGVAFFPSLDLFGKELARKQDKKNRENLEKLDASVKKRLKTLKRSDGSKNSPEVEKVLSQIKNQFNSLKKSQQKANQEKLRQIQRNLSHVWKEKQREKLRDQLQTNLGKQSFGMLDKKEQTWQKQLKKNNFSALKKEAEALRQMAQKISEMTDSPEKEAMQKELRQRMKTLANFMASQLGSKSAQGALKNAMKQLDMSNLKGLSKEALQAMQNSMQLMKRELDRLGEMTNDISQLEMAMQASQLAQQLNRLGEMKNADSGEMESMEDYADFYKKLMDAQKNGKKGCQNGDPRGGGPPPEENPDAKTATEKKVAKSPLQPGKILMKWNTKGMGKTGKANEQYLQSVKKVKQGVSEAILKEQVPPGYHKSIQKYFDNIDK